MKFFLTILGAALLALAAPAMATVAQYEVRGVKWNDKLNVRAAPTHTARIVGRIPPNGREIEIIDRGRGQWVKIAYGRMKGFVNRRYLALSKPRAARVAPASESAAAAVEAAPAPASAADVVVEPKALAAPEVKPVPPAPAPALAPEPQKLADPAKVDTALPGVKREEMEETPALMKPPADYVPEAVPPTAPKN